MKRSRSSPYAILGLLSLRPMSGYDVRKEATESVGHFWSESYGQIYPALRELVAAGLARRRTERMAGRPDRHVYEITVRGREELRRWVVEPPRPTPMRSELLLKLFFGDAESAGAQVAWVEQVLAESTAQLVTYAAIRRELEAERTSPHATHWLLTLRFGECRAESNQRWAREALATLRAVAGKSTLTGATHARTGAPRSGTSARIAAPTTSPRRRSHAKARGAGRGAPS
jgi:PadR family transcriptional regulator, regulatory protein AphA